MKDSILMILQISRDFDLWSGSLLSLCVTCFHIRSTECKKNIQCTILTKSVNCAAGSLHQAIFKVHIHFPIDCMNAWIWIFSHQKCIFPSWQFFELDLSQFLHSCGKYGEHKMLSVIRFNFPYKGSKLTRVMMSSVKGLDTPLHSMFFLYFVGT